MVMAHWAVAEGVSCFIHINHCIRALWGVRNPFLYVILGKEFMVYPFCGRSMYRLVIYLAAYDISPFDHMAGGSL
jgi:hypothetical protein